MGWWFRSWTQRRRARVASGWGRIGVVLDDRATSGAAGSAAAYTVSTCSTVTLAGSVYTLERKHRNVREAQASQEHRSAERCHRHGARSRRDRDRPVGLRDEPVHDLG